MKKIHYLIYKTFIGPFAVTFFITNFLLLMIWFWKWLEDIVGKGLEISVIFELIGYAALNQIPMSLPLAVLLSSIMTFGKLGETIELTAMKSLGISLWKAMSPLIFAVSLLTVGAFYINNNILPKTNTELKKLLRDITSKKPELSIPEGVFYKGLEGYTIRVGKKYPDKTLKNVLIYDNKSMSNSFISADSGSLEMSTNGDYLVLMLYNGTAYENQKEKDENRRTKRSYPLVTNQFKVNQLTFDLSSYEFSRSEDDLRSRSKLSDVYSLKLYIDTFQINIENQKNKLITELNSGFYFNPNKLGGLDTLNYQSVNFKEKLDTASLEKKKSIYRHASEITRNAKNNVYGTKIMIGNYRESITKYKIELHKKITFSVACLLLFFVGAPFGAIVKKGGLGIPVIISAVIFILYHVFTIVGEKLAENGDWQVAEGVWLASFLVIPLGLFLTIKATSDSSLFDLKTYIKWFKKKN